MSYKNKTYVIFDADEDMWAYGRMKGWKVNDNIDFNFYDAHDVNTLRDGSSEDTVKRKLRERMANAKQAVVLIGEKTKNLHRFVRWEIDQAISNDLPIVAVNLNGDRQMDSDRCPPILKEHFAMHVSYKMRIIRYALDHFPDFYHTNKRTNSGPYYYKKSVYDELEL